MELDNELYRRFLQGDEAGLVQIIDTYKDGLIFYLNGIVSDLAAAEDLAEDTFLKLVLKKPRFSARSSFKTWLYAVGRNLALDHLRRRKNAPVSDDSLSSLRAPEADLELRCIRQEKLRSVHAAMKKLKPEYRQVLWLIYFEDFSCAQAGKILKKSTHNTEMLVSRARRALKNQLIKEGFDYEDI